MKKVLLNSVRNAKAQYLLQVQIPAEAFTAVLDEVFEAQKPMLDVPGVEKGKATRQQAEAALGADYFYGAAAQSACVRALEELIQEEQLDVVGYPDITSCSTNQEGLFFTAVCDACPSVTLGEYKNICPVLDKPTVTDDEVTAALQTFARRASETTDLDRPAQEGDTVRLDMAGTIDGVPFPGGSAEDFGLVIGSHTFLPGLEEAMTGMSAGESKDIPVTFPDNYTPELAGKNAVFHVTVNKVCKVDTPEVNDDFAQRYFEMSLEALRENLKEHMLLDKLADWQAAREDTAIQMAADNMQVELPESMIRKEIDRLTGDLANRLAKQGETLESYQKSVNMGEDEFLKTARDSAVINLRQELLLRAVQEKEHLVIDKAFEKKAVAFLAERYGTSEQNIRESLKDEMMQRELLRMKVLEVIMAPDAE